MILDLLTAELIEVAHATRDPIIDRTEALVYRGLLRQWKAFRDEALPRLQVLFEADENEVAIQNVLSGLRALSDSISLEAYAALLGKSLTAGANQSGSLVGQTYTSWPESVAAWFHDHGLERIGRDIDETTRARLKTIIEAGLEDGQNYQKIARAIRQSGVFSRARAKTIAVTEIGNAFSQGTLAGAREIAARGEDVEKSWMSQGDCCDVCDGNTEQGWIDVGSSFQSGNDAPLAHPNCRCALLTRVVQVRVPVAA